MNASRVTNNIQEMINKRANKLKNYRATSKRDMNTLEVMKTFFKELEELYDFAIDEMQYYDAIKRKAAWMHSKIMALDSHADVSINYNNQEEEVYWKDLKVMNVLIRWSEGYRTTHPLADEMESYDPMTIAMSEMLEG